MKDVHTTGDALSPQNIQHYKHEIRHFIFNFWGYFLPSWIHIWICIPNADPDPADQNRCESMRVRIHAGKQQWRKRNQIPKAALYCT